MATIREYRICDICGKKLNKTIEEFHYRIEPKNPLRMAIWSYINGNPYDGFWTMGIDMCSDCWEQMKTWIKVNKT
jgi:hypothetical protein